MAPDGLLFDAPRVRAQSQGRPVRKRPAPKPIDATSAEQPWPLNGEINVVLFAGMGGACQGIEEAGFPVHVAVNHDKVAIAAHKALNPHTRHIQADIYEVCPLDATGRRRVNILWASPDCRDHSVAKGGAPRSPRVRSMPWQVCRWVGVLRLHGLGPRVVYLENVREIRGWGPLVAKRDKATGRVLKLDGTVAAKGERVPVREQQLVRDPARVGRTYRAWVRHLQGLGVDYQDRDLCCGDFGVPTTRKRLFGVGTLDGTPPAWLVQTHAHRLSADVLAGRYLPHPSAGLHVVDWSLPIPSIFGRKKELVRATKRRIAVGFDRFVMRSERPFLVHLTHHGARPGIDTAEAPPTFTGAHRGEMAVVAPGLVPTTHRSSPDRVHDGREATPTLTAGVKGGEFAVMGAQVVFRGDSPGADMDAGLPTVTANSFHKRPGGSVPLGVMAAHVTRYHGERRPGEEGRGVDLVEGLPTSTTENRFGVVAATLAPAIMCNNTNNVGAGGEDALPAVTTGNRNYVVAGTMVEHRGNSIGQPADAALGAQTQAPHHAVVGAWMVKQSTDVVGLPMEDAASSLVTKVGPQALGAAYMVHQRGTGVPSNAEDAARTLATGGDRGGDHVGVTAAFLTEYYGTGGQHNDVGEALNTASTRDRFALTGAELVARGVLTEAQYARAREVAEFLREFGVWDGGEIVIVGPWIVVDIGMRMLRPHEAAAAHELTLPDLIEVDGVRRPLTKTEAMRLVGNSVPKRMAKLLVLANARHALAPRMASAEAAE